MEEVNTYSSIGTAADQADCSYPPLHQAVVDEDIAKMTQLIIEEGADVEEQTDDGLTPLMLACIHQHTTAVETLLQHGASPDTPSNSDVTWLHVICATGQKRWVDVFIGSNIEFRVKDNHGRYPLHYACLYDHPKIVEALLSSRKNRPNEKDKFGYTALHGAAYSGSLRSIRWLYDNNVDRSVRSNEGYLPLCVAVGQKHTEATYQLSKCNASCGCYHQGRPILHTQDSLNMSQIFECLPSTTARQTAAGRKLYKTKGLTAIDICAQLDLIDICTALLNRSNEHMTSDTLGFTPLHWACLHGSLGVTRLLVEHYGIEIINQNDRARFTPLMLAATGDNVDLLCYLISEGADLESSTSNGTTAVHMACLFDKVECLRCLRGHGASMISTTNLGYYASHAAAYGTSKACLEVAIISGCPADGKSKQDVAPLEFAVKNESIDCVKLLIVENADINSRNYEGASVIMWASLRGNIDMVTLLLEKGAAVDIKTRDGETALGLAANHGHLDVCRMLIDAGISANPEGASFRTPLEYAIAKDYPSIIELLERTGVNMSVATKSGFFPLLLASYWGSYRSIDKLVDLGADTSILHANKLLMQNLASSKFCNPGKVAQCFKHIVLEKDQLAATIRLASSYGLRDWLGLLCNDDVDINCKDNEGRTALSLACEHGHEDCCTFLLEQGANPDIPDEKERLPIHYAAISGKENIIKTLAEYEASLDLLDIDRRSAIVFSIIHHHENCFLLLETLGAHLDDNYTDADGLGIAHKAVSLFNASSMRILFDSGIPCDTRISGRDVLYFACLHGKLESVKLIIECLKSSMIKKETLSKSNSNVDENLIHLNHEKELSIFSDTLGLALLASIESEDDECFNLLLENGANVNVMRSCDGGTPLLLAVIFGRLDLMTILHSDGEGAKLNLSEHNKKMLVIMAVQEKRPAELKWLLDRGLDVESVDSDITASIRASMSGCVRCLELLHTKGADLNAEGVGQWKPIHYAIYHNNYLVTKYLLAANIVLEYPHTVLGSRITSLIQFAALCNTKDTSIVKLLLTTGKVFYQSEAHILSGSYDNRIAILATECIESILHLSFATDSIQMIHLVMRAILSERDDALNYILQKLSSLNDIIHSGVNSMPESVDEVLQPISLTCIKRFDQIPEVSKCVSEDLSHLGKSVGTTYLCDRICTLVEDAVRVLSKKSLDVLKITMPYEFFSSGSLRLGTKVGEFDEFDYLLVFNIDDLLPSNMVDNLTLLLRLQNLNDQFKPIETLKEEMYMILLGVKKTLHTAGAKLPGRTYIDSVVNTPNSPCINMNLSWLCPNQHMHAISVDIAIAIKRSGDIKWDRPQCLQNHPLFNDNKAVYSSPAIYIAHKIDEVYPWKRTWSPFDVSLFGLIEEALPNLKDSLRLVKFIRDLVFPRYTTITGSLKYSAIHLKDQELISSFSFQQILLDEVMQYYDQKDWMDAHIWDRLQNVFRALKKDRLVELYTGESKSAFNVPADEKNKLMTWINKDVDLIINATEKAKTNYIKLETSEVFHIKETLESYSKQIYLIKSDTELEAKCPSDVFRAENTWDKLMFDDVYYYRPPCVAENLLYSPLVAEIVKIRLESFKSYSGC